MLSLSLLLCTIMYAQQEITGTVTDAMGPVIGATVMEKGTSNGTVTDFDGNFKLKVQPGTTLVFTYIGYKTLEQPAKDGMAVTMEENAKELAEVVVTGYTTQRKADLTGASMTLTGTCITSEETLLRQFPVRINDHLRLSTDRFDLGVMRQGESKES